MALKNFEKFDINKLLNWLLFQYNVLNGYSAKLYLIIIKRILFRTVIIKYAKFDNDFSILYFDYKMNARRDIAEMVNSVLGTFDYKCNILSFYRKSNFSFRRLMNALENLFNWKKELQESKYNYKEKLIIYALFLELSDVLEDLKTINFTQYKLTLCFYDSEPFQNLFSQFAKMHGCKTATLQHGIMLAPRPSVVNNIDFAGIEFYSFVCDYFLAWNEFTKNEAIKAGIDDNRIRVLGISKCIGKPQLNCNKNAHSIGVFLDGEFEKLNNKPLISIVQEWARMNSMKCVFRYHPNFIGTEYSGLIDNNVSTVCPKSITLQEFIENNSFFVLANSTVLFELEYFCVPFIRYSTGDDTDKFRDYPSLSFTNLEEFGMSFNKMQNSPLRKFVSCDDAYSDFFANFES